MRQDGGKLDFGCFTLILMRAGAICPIKSPPSGACLRNGAALTLVKRIAFVASLALLCSCTKHVTKSELVGDYSINIPGLDDRLQLRSDGTYLHSFVSPGSQPTSQTGKWAIEPPSQDGLIVTFEGFILALTATKPRPAFFPATVEKGLHPLRLVIDRNPGTFYEKVPSQ